jgi:hypothetical protein
MDIHPQTERLFNGKLYTQIIVELLGYILYGALSIKMWIKLDYHRLILPILEYLECQPVPDFQQTRQPERMLS